MPGDPQFLADHLTLFQPGGPDYVRYNTLSAMPSMVRRLENQSLGDAISCQESTLSYTFCCFSTALIYFNVVPINSLSLKILFVSSGRGSFSPTSYVVPPYFYSRNDTG